MTSCDAPLPDTLAPDASRLTVDTAALVANWRRFARAGAAAACGAAVKADGYGLGARPIAAALVAAGCRDLLVAHWHEVAALGPQPDGVRVAVLHGVMPGDMARALASPAVPVLVTAGQVQAWKVTGRPCDVMVDTGLNRLGIDIAEARSGLLDGLAIDTLHSHLACSETPASPANEAQRAAFADIAAVVPARRRALANSAGIGLGPGWHFDLTRPGIGLYGGGASPDAHPLAPVAGIATRIIQLRDVPAGASIGYGATYTAAGPLRVAVVALGYADGYPRSLSDRGRALVDGVPCPVVGRISMDLTIIDVSAAPDLAEGDWLTMDFDLAGSAAASGRSEYELLTGLGARYARVHT
ncbi:alanine racemase [Sandarakinorhabdus sp. DWP1-3-1]|uniref:alanine racemase n=1 Tax=Sandarakinorhabdus sp. DWP1-3-1 TaxID=2804627 RepID=UPI003CEAE754